MKIPSTHDWGEGETMTSNILCLPNVMHHRPARESRYFFSHWCHKHSNPETANQVDHIDEK